MSATVEPIVFLSFGLINIFCVMRWISKRITGKKWEEQRPVIMVVYGAHLFISFGIIFISMIETQILIYLLKK